MKYRDRICAQCGKVFSPRQANAKFCSRECGNYYRRMHPMTDEEKLKKGYTWRQCQICDKKFLGLMDKTVVCPPCQRLKNNREKSTAPKAEKVDIDTFEAEARRRNLSYGQLQALKRIGGAAR